MLVGTLISLSSSTIPAIIGIFAPK